MITNFDLYKCWKFQVKRPWLSNYTQNHSKSSSSHTTEKKVLFCDDTCTDKFQDPAVLITWSNIDMQQNQNCFWSFGFGFGLRVITYLILESNIRYVITSKPKPNLTKTKTIKTKIFGFGACLVKADPGSSLWENVWTNSIALIRRKPIPKISYFWA